MDPLISWILWKREWKEYVMFDAGLRWNLATVLMCSLVGEAWFLLAFHSGHENIRGVHRTDVFD